MATVLFPLAIGASPLLRDRRPQLPRWALVRAVAQAAAGVRALHSGHVGDYVAWLVAGTAALGASFPVLLA